MKESCLQLINVIIKQHKNDFWKNMLNLSMKMSSIILIIVENNLDNKIILKNIFSLIFMKVSSILVINVIKNLQEKVISRNIFSLNTKVLSILVVFVTKNFPVKII